MPMSETTTSFRTPPANAPAGRHVVARVIMALLVAGLGTLLGGDVASARHGCPRPFPKPPPQYPPLHCRGLHVGASSVPAGHNLAISGEGYGPRSSVAVGLGAAGPRLADVVTDGDGAFSLTVAVPAAASAGRHRVVAVGHDEAGSPLSSDAEITVTRRPGRALALVPVASNTPAPSGNGTTALAAVAAVALLAAGTRAVLVARARRGP